MVEFITANFVPLMFVALFCFCLLYTSRCV